MNIALIDNYDSFTGNLAHLVRNITGKWPQVFKNDLPDISVLSAYDKILLSPGPGIPAEAGALLPLIQEFAPRKAMLGVCLGHQAIAASVGAVLHNLADVYHGVQTEIQVIQAGTLFASVPETFTAGRYHSWVVDRDNLPQELEITATDTQGHIMALRHRTYDLQGVQFHPESIMTSCGYKLMHNWINS